MSSFQPPPTYALPIIVDERTQVAQFNPLWLKWFVDFARVLSDLAPGGTSLVHNGLGGLQGGTTNERYHLTYAQYSAMAASEAFPIGAIFTSVSSTNPATVLNYGTWVAFGAGKVLVGVDGGDADFTPVESSGGAKEQDLQEDGRTAKGATGTAGHFTNVLQPYITVYFWKRTA